MAALLTALYHLWACLRRVLSMENSAADFRSSQVSLPFKMGRERAAGDEATWKDSVKKQESF